jgi:hypothetical protein
MTASTILPSNDALKDQLHPHDMYEYAEMRKKALELAAKKPELKTGLVTRYMHDFLDSAADRATKLKQHGSNLKDAGAKHIDDDMTGLFLDHKNKFVEEFTQKTLPQYDAADQAGFNAFSRRMQGPTIPGMVANQFYNEDKGGMRWGGVVGAALGGLFILSKLGTGTLGIIGSLIAAVAGAWLVNKTMDYGSEIMERRKARQQQQANAAQKQPEASVAPGQQQTQSPAVDTAKLDAARQQASQAVNRDMLSVQQGSSLPIDFSPFGVPIYPAKPAEEKNQRPEKMR